MYEILQSNKEPLLDKNIYYKSNTSIIYKKDNYLYKIYLKKEPFKRHVMDYLIENYELLKEISIPPKNKLKVEDNYGLKMDYYESIDFYKYIDRIDTKEFIRVLKLLSDNLKIINNLGICLTDLHHHNILIGKDGTPKYIDLDDARVNEYDSTHICFLVRNLHNVEEKGYDYEDKLMKEGHLDREALTLMLLDYIFDRAVEKYNYQQYQEKIDEIENIFSKKIIKIFRELKDKDDDYNINKFNYYIGDYLNNNTINKIRRLKHENSNI